MIAHFVARGLLLLFLSSLAWEQSPCFAGEGGADAGPAYDQLPERAVARLGCVRLRHDAGVVDLCFLPDGKQVVSIGIDRKVRFWRVANGVSTHVSSIEQSMGIPFTVTATEGGVLVGTSHGQLLKYSGEGVQEGEALETRVQNLVIAPGGQRSAGLGSEALTLLILDGEGTVIQTLDSPLGRVGNYRFSQDATRIAVSCWEAETHRTGTATILLADVASGETLRSLEVKNNFQTSLAISPGGKVVALGAIDGTLRLLNTSTSILSDPVRQHDEAITALVFSHDGQWLASGGRDGKINLYDGETGDWIHQIEAHLLNVTGLAFSPDSKTLASSSGDFHLGLWNVSTGERLVPTPGHYSTVSAVSVTPDGKHILSGGYDSTVRVWNGKTNDEERTVSVAPGFVTAVEAAPDGRWAATVGQAGILRRVDLETGEIEYEERLSDVALFDLDISADGKRIVASSADGKVRVVDAETGRPILTVDAGPGFVFSTCFSPDGTRVITGSSQIKIYDIETGDLVRDLRGPDAPVYSLVMDGKGNLYSASADRKIIRWTVDGSEPPAEYLGHPGRVQSLALSPDGEVLASSGYGENDIRLWNARTGETIGELKGHTGTVLDLQFMSEGRTLISAGSDSNVLVWDVSDS